MQLNILVAVLVLLGTVSFGQGSPIRDMGETKERVLKKSPSRISAEPTQTFAQRARGNRFNAGRGNGYEPPYQPEIKKNPHKFVPRLPSGRGFQETQRQGVQNIGRPIKHNNRDYVIVYYVPYAYDDEYSHYSMLAYFPWYESYDQSPVHARQFDSIVG